MQGEWRPIVKLGLRNSPSRSAQISLPSSCSIGSSATFEAATVRAAVWHYAAVAKIAAIRDPQGKDRRRNFNAKPKRSIRPDE